MLRDGYDAVDVSTIAAEAGIGRTTFFRYFGSKPAVVWSAFDATITWLQESLTTHKGQGDPLDAVRAAVVGSTRSALYSSDVWLERFKLLDSHPSLQSGAYEHWEAWRRAVAEHIAEAEGLDPSDPVPMAIAGACHGVFVSELRNLHNTDDDREVLLQRFDKNLAQVCEALRALLR